MSSGGWFWAVVGVAVIFVVALVITWNTAYERGRSDGITQLACVERAQAHGQSGTEAGCFR